MPSVFKAKLVSLNKSKLDSNVITENVGNEKKDQIVPMGNYCTAINGIDKEV